MSGRRRPRTALPAALCAGAFLVFSLFCGPARAQDEGARAYELAPAGSQAINLYGMFGRGDFVFDPGAAVAGGARLIVDGGILEYSRGFALAGRAGTFFATLPFGTASRSVSVDSVSAKDSSSGIGDLQLTAAFGLLGSPALSEKDYESYRPRLALSLLTRLFLPTGAYDRNSPVNLGQNRWSGQLGLPLALYLGDSLLDPALTSFELIPSVIVYSDNDDLASGSVSHAAPLLQLESHITRNLNQSIWVSIDTLLIEGGETSTDGVSNHNRQRSFAVGATGSAALSDAVAMTLSYTDEVSRNRSGATGHVLRIIVEFAL